MKPGMPLAALAAGIGLAATLGVPQSAVRSTGASLPSGVMPATPPRVAPVRPYRYCALSTKTCTCSRLARWRPICRARDRARAGGVAALQPGRVLAVALRRPSGWGEAPLVIARRPDIQRCRQLRIAGAMLRVWNTATSAAIGTTRPWPRRLPRQSAQGPQTLRRCSRPAATSGPGQNPHVGRRWSTPVTFATCCSFSGSGCWRPGAATGRNASRWDATNG